MTGSGGGGELGHYAAAGDGGDGGAIYALSSTIRLNESEFSWNHTGSGGSNGLGYGDGGDGGNGGTLCIQAGSVAEIVGCTFDNSYTGPGGNGEDSPDGFGGIGGYGGTVYCESSALRAQLSSIKHSTTGDGGELGGYISGTSDGGGLYALSSTIALTKCEFTFNLTGRAGYYRYARSSGRGGAACFLGSAVSIDGCLIQRNKTGDGIAGARGNGRSGQGGGLFFDACSSVQVYNCTIAENGTGNLQGTGGENLNRTGDGGGLAILQSPARVENCLIYGNFTGDGDMEVYANSSGNGGGIYCAHGTGVEIVGCTVVGNRCGIGGDWLPDGPNGQGGGV